MAALAVPRRQRAEWLDEWKSELWYVATGGSGRSLRFCLGSFADALWVRRNSAAQPPAWLESPLRCLAVLGILLAVTVSVFMLRAPWGRIGSGFAHAAVMFVAWALVPVTTSLRHGEYPATKRAARWTFLAAKSATVVAIVWCGMLDLAPVLGPIQPHGFLIGYLVAFRWVVTDQRRRCPVCLRLLSCPARIGERSHTFLDSDRIELLCARGHGSLQVPEVETSYSAERWQDLDSSWAALFRG